MKAAHTGAGRGKMVPDEGGMTAVRERLHRTLDEEDTLRGHPVTRITAVLTGCPEGVGRCADVGGAVGLLRGHRTAPLCENTRQ